MADAAQADAEVAQEFREYLKELEDPKANEIRWLTQMVNDQSDYAYTISNVLKEFISKAPANRKLGGLFVLDSIAKNLANTFTQHLSKGLFDTFWDAYTRVDNKTRATMVSLLNSWENPGQGVSVRVPVFPVEVTRRIRESLNAANAAIARIEQRQQQHMPPSLHPGQVHAYNAPRPLSRQGAEQPWRYPTPPQAGAYGTPGGHASGFSPPPPPATHTPMNGYPQHQPPPQHAPPQQYSNGLPHAGQHAYYDNSHIQPPQSYAPTPPADFAQVMGSLEHLIGLLRYRTSVNPYDQEASQKLSVVSQLQIAATSQPHIEPHVWAGMKREVNTLLQIYGQPPLSANPGPFPPPVPTPQQYATPYQPPPPPQQSQPPQQAQPTQPVFDPSALANLSAVLGPPQTSTPQTYNPAPHPTDPPKPPSSGEGQGWKQDPNFLSQLSALSGILGPKNPGAGVAAATSNPTAAALGGLLSLANDAQLTNASIRKPRPELTRTLWSGKTQCRTCGRRFATSEAGHEQKKRHMDYHFRTRMRMSDVKQSTIATRSWYVSEIEWIRFREVDDAEAANMVDQTQAARNGQDEGQKKAARYVRVPSDKSKANKSCPICQDDFENTWNEEAQEWVWMDCIKGTDGRYYHHSCRQDVEKDAAAAKEREERARETREREARRKAQDAERKQTESNKSVNVGPSQTPAAATSDKASKEDVKAAGVDSESKAAAVTTTTEQDSVPNKPPMDVAPKSPDSVLGKRKAEELAPPEDDDEDYEPGETERRVSPRIDATASV